MRRGNRKIIVTVLVALLSMLGNPVYAVPLSITQNQTMAFGSIGVPGGPEQIIMDETGAITSGSEFINGGIQRNGAYTINGDAGLIDISVINITTCDPSVTVAQFTGTFGSGADALTNIDIAPAENIQLDGGNGRNMELGATLNFNASTPEGACAITFDLDIDYH